MKKSLVLISLLLLTLNGCSLFNADDEPEVPSPIPGKIVFSMPSAENGTYQIYVMKPSGTGLKQLTHFGEFEALQPSWSPDGSKIVFTSSKKGTTAGNAIYIMNADGSDPHPMKVFPEHQELAYPGQYPKWSPDGTKIAYSQCLNCSSGGNNHEIFVFDLEKDSVFQITDNPAIDRFPDWNKINEVSFLTNRDFINTSTRLFNNIYVSNITKNSAKQVTTNGKVNRPNGHPITNLIAFTESNKDRVFMKNLVTNELDSIVTEGFFSGTPQWSKNGTNFIAYNRIKESDILYLIRFGFNELTNPLDSLNTNLNYMKGRSFDWFYDESQEL